MVFVVAMVASTTRKGNTVMAVAAVATSQGLRDNNDKHMMALLEDTYSHPIQNIAAAVNTTLLNNQL